MGYYMGDYYRGDPGFWSVLGGIAKKAVGFIPGVGPAISAGLDAIVPAAKPAAAGAAVSMVKPGFFKGATQTLGRGILKHPVLTGAGAAGLVGAAGAVAGAAAQKHGLLGGGGKKHRRMRVTNPKALRRAIRRTTGFAKLAMRTIHIVHPKKKGRFGGFKRRRRAA